MRTNVKWWLALAFVLVFLAGVATGLLAGAHHARQIVFGGRHSLHFSERMRKHLKRELDLTPDQHEKVSPILDEMARQLHQIREETGRRVAATMSQSHSQMAPLLTPEQREKLERMRERHRRILHRRGHHPPP